MQRSSKFTCDNLPMVNQASQITLTSTVCARSGLLSTELSGTEAVMLDIDKGAYFGVDSVGKTIWDAIAEPRCVRDVVSIVEQRYEVSREVAQADTTEFLTELLASGLITVADDGDAS